MKSKLMNAMTIGILFLTMSVIISSEIVNSYIPGVTYLTFVSRPSDQTVNQGTYVTVSWKAKSDFGGKGYIIYKNGVNVKSGTWSTNVAFSYSYTASTVRTDEIRCYLYDSYKSLNDYCYIYVQSTLDSDGDGLTDSKEATLQTDPYDFYDPLGQHFEDQSVGQNPNGWSVLEYSGYSDVSIASSSGLGLTNAKPGNLVKIVQSQYGAAPEIYKYVSYSLLTPKLVSFTAGYYSQYNYELDSAYLALYSNTGSFILKLEFQFDRVAIWETSTYCRNVDLDFNEKQIYKYDLILQNDASGYVDYSLYINGIFFTYGTTAKNSYIGVVEFGIDASTYTEFYVDNIYIGNVNVGNVQYNIPQHQAIPLCWLYAPDVAGVLSEYHVGETTSVEITVALTLGGGDAIEVEFGIDIISWYKELTHTYYGVMLDSGDQDVIVHIRYEYTVSKKSIYLPGSSNIYLDVLIDCNYITSKYYDLPASQFLAEYGWVPTDYSQTGITKIGSHTKTYSLDYGYQEEYYYQNDDDLLSTSGGISVGKGLSIGVEVCYSNTIYAHTSLWVDRLLEPKFDYGKPSPFYAYLGIQPYIVRPLGTL
ncbi:MAG: thrombospondin type 3 repeat-containing protein [Candidatus Thorarchaeota archaeon]